MPSQSLDERLTEKSVQLAELGVRYLLLTLRSLVASILLFLFYKCALADAHQAEMKVIKMNFQFLLFDHGVRRKYADQLSKEQVK